MKKIVIICCILCMALCFAACGQNKNGPSATKATLKTSAKATEPAVTTAATEKADPTPTTEPTPTVPPVDVSKFTNVALNKPVTEQGHAYESDWWSKNFLTDGIKMEDDTEGQTNGWMSDASDEIDGTTWVYVDLETAYTVQAVAVYPRESEMFFPVAYEIQLSTDAENWTTVKTVSDDYGYLDEDRCFAVEPTEARYVRVLVTERYDQLPGSGINGYIAEISEIEVYA